MCRSCGAIVGAGEAQCAVCNAPTAQSPERLQHLPPADRETIRFARAILNRPNMFTIVLLMTNLFVFMLMWQSSGTTSDVLWRGFEEPVLTAYGAKLNYLINEPHYQWWRFITPMFVHINLPHLLVNMYSLWIVGPYVEKLYGSAKFVVFWVGSGIAGVIGSYLSVQPQLATSGLGRFLFKHTDVASAGASGALFGLVGVLFVFGIKFRRELPEGFRRAFGTGMLPIIIINLFIGYVGRGFIDNAAHLGGLLSGAALAAMVQYRRPGERQGMAVAWRILKYLALALVIVGFYKLGRNFNRTLHLANASVERQQTQILLNFVGALNALRDKGDAIVKTRDLSDLSSSSQRALQTPAPDARANELRQRLLSILSRMNSAVASASPPPEPGPVMPAPVDENLVAEFEQWKIDYDQWLESSRKQEN